MKHLKEWNRWDEANQLWHRWDEANQLTLEQREWMHKCSYGDWDFDKTTGLVNCHGKFLCQSQELIDFKGIKFGKINGIFSCIDNKLTSLDGAPRIVNGDFHCNSNRLTNLKGAPLEVHGAFDCSNNYLISLEGLPSLIEGFFSCHKNNVNSDTLRRIQRLVKKNLDYLTALIIVLSEGVSPRDRKSLLKGVSNLNDPLVLKNSVLSISKHPDSMRLLSVMKKEAPDLWRGIISQMDSPETGEESTILGDYGF